MATKAYPCVLMLGLLATMLTPVEARVTMFPYGQRMCEEICTITGDQCTFDYPPLSCTIIDLEPSRDKLKDVLLKISGKQVLMGRRNFLPWGYLYETRTRSPLPDDKIGQNNTSSWRITGTSMKKILIPEETLSLTTKRDYNWKSKCLSLVQTQNPTVTMKPSEIPPESGNFASRFMIACKDGEVEIVRCILDLGLADINMRWDRDETAVMVAAEAGQTSVFDYLVSRNCDLTTNDKDTVLHYACVGGSLAIVRSCVEKYHMDKEIRGSLKRTPLLLAAKVGQLEIYKYLNKDCDATKTDEDGANALHLACLSGNTNLVEMLLDHFDKESVTNLKATPLMYAARGNTDDVTILNLLMKQGCNIRAVDVHNDAVLHYACVFDNGNIARELIDKYDVPLEIKGHDGRTPFLTAAAATYGSLRVLELLVELGCNIDAKDNLDKTAIHLAGGTANCDMVELLIDTYKFDVNAKGHKGRTPLAQAVFHGNQDTFECLLWKGANPQLKDEDEANLLHLSSSRFNVDIVRKLVTDSQLEIDAVDGLGKSPIMIAAEFGKFEIFKVLLKAGATVRSIDINGDTPLHLACQGGNVKIVKTLLKVKKLKKERRDKQKLTPILVAAAYGHLEVYKYLRSMGCDTSASTDGVNSLHLACGSGNIDLVIFLLNHFDKECRTSIMATPLHYASTDENDNSAVLDYLIHEGCDTDAVDALGSSLIHYACREGNINIVRKLLDEYNVPIEKNDAHGVTPFMYAALFNQPRVMELLVQRGCNIHAVDIHGDTVLHAVTMRTVNYNMFEDLINKYKLDINAKGEKGITAIASAVCRADLEWFEILLAKGADLDAVDDDGNTIFHLACEGGNLTIVKRLIKKRKFNKKKNSHNKTPYDVATKTIKKYLRRRRNKQKNSN